MPSNPKRPAPGRTGSGTTTPEATPPTDVSGTPEQSTAEQPNAEQANAEQPKAEQPKAEQPKAAPPPQQSAPAPQQRLNITDLKDMSIQKLTQIAKDLAVGGATGMRKQELIFQILKAQTELSGFIFSEGEIGRAHV